MFYSYGKYSILRKDYENVSNEGDILCYQLEKLRKDMVN